MDSSRARREYVADYYRKGQDELRKLVAKREAAANAAEHADNMYRIHAESQEILLRVAEARLADDPPSGAPNAFADFPPRGMPNSEARKRLEERQADTCERCGRSGVGLFRMGQSTLCVSKPACVARVSAAKACLEPVPA